MAKPPESVLLLVVKAPSLLQLRTARPNFREKKMRKGLSGRINYTW
jgi:hypothetical protein